ncbi:MAG: SDR family oxidoreductase [Acidobacteriota bacterium]|nr:SDR family oxidoreductase [Acidobacteriota bacterium]
MSASPHRILVLGGTGPTGRLIVEQALEQGHSVTVLARRPEGHPIGHASLAVLDGDVLEVDLAPVLAGHDTVVSSLGRGMSLRSEHLMSRATPRILAAMERAGIARLVFLSAYGVGGTAAEAPLLLRLLFRVMFSDIYADKAVAEAAVRESSLNWTILAPVKLTNGPAAGRYRAGEDLRVPGFAKISRAAVAASVLGSIDDPATFRKRLVVAA